MTPLDHTLPVEATDHNASEAGLQRRLSSLAAWTAGWIRTAADYYVAAAMYEQLSRLSDAELRRRGLSREALARDICEISDAAAKRRKNGSGKWPSR